MVSLFCWLSSKTLDKAQQEYGGKHNDYLGKNSAEGHKFADNNNGYG